MTPDQQTFLAFVAQKITNDPELAAYLPDYVALGLRNAVRQANERAADMEVALVAMSDRRLKNGKELMKQKLAKWRGKTAMNWDDLLKEPKK